MGEVVPGRTSPTLHPPYHSHCASIVLFKSAPVHQLSWQALQELILLSLFLCQQTVSVSQLCNFSLN